MQGIHVFSRRNNLILSGQGSVENSPMGEEEPVKTEEEKIETLDKEYCFHVVDYYENDRVLPIDYLLCWANAFPASKLILVDHGLFKDHVIPLWKECHGNRSLRADSCSSASPNWTIIKEKFPHLSTYTHAVMVCKLRDGASLCILLDKEKAQLEWISIIDAMILEEKEEDMGEVHTKRYLQIVAEWFGLFMLKKRCNPKDALTHGFVNRINPKHCTQVSMLWLGMRLYQGNSFVNAKAKLDRDKTKLSRFIDKFRTHLLG